MGLVFEKNSHVLLTRRNESEDKNIEKEKVAIA